MARKNFTVDGVLAFLKRKHDVKIIGRTIEVLNGKSKKVNKSSDLGNGSWAKIDFLVNYNNYTLNHVGEFTKERTDC